MSGNCFFPVQMLLKCPALRVPNSYRGFCHQAMNSSLTHWQWTRFNAAVKHGSTTTNLHHVGFTSSLYSVHYTLSLQDIWQMKCMVHCFSTDRVGVLCKGTYFNVFFPSEHRSDKACHYPWHPCPQPPQKCQWTTTDLCFFASVIERLVCARNVSCFSATQ